MTEELTGMVRRDTFAYGLVGLDVAALVLWTLLLTTDSGLSLLASDLFFFLLAPAALVLLGCLGFWMWGRVWLAAQAHHRTPRSLVVLAWASVLVLMPLGFYALLGLYVVTFPEF